MSLKHFTHQPAPGCPATQRHFASEQPNHEPPGVIFEHNHVENEFLFDMATACLHCLFDAGIGSALGRFSLTAMQKEIVFVAITPVANKNKTKSPSKVKLCQNDIKLHFVIDLAGFGINEHTAPFR